MDEENKQGEAKPEEKLSKHELKKLKRQQRDEQRNLEREKYFKEQRKKNIFKYSLIFISLIIIIYFGFKFFSNIEIEKPYSNGQVHWHAALNIEACGDKVDLPKADPITSLHGQPFLGTPLLHTHDDAKIHIEGVVNKAEDITLGRFFDVIKVDFSNDKIMDHKNGDLCNDKPGELKISINGIENLDPRNHAISDGDSINIKFE